MIGWGLSLPANDNKMQDFIFQYVDQLFGQLVDPKKRVFCLYLACSVVLACAVMIRRHKQTPTHALTSALSTKVWRGASAQADYAIILINHALMLLISPLLLGRLAVASFIYLTLQSWFSTESLAIPVSPWLISISFTACLFIADDASRYWLHRLMHTYPILWAFHKVHHSARTLTPLTVFRVHPVEAILYMIRSALINGATVACFIFMFGNSIKLTTVLGSSIFIFLFNIVGSNLRHSHIRLSYPHALETIFISPFQHQLHHSSATQHHDSNYGAALAIWDYFGGTLVYSKYQSRPRFGLNRRPINNEQTLSSLYLKPCSEALSLVTQSAKKRLKPNPL